MAAEHGRGVGLLQHAGCVLERRVPERHEARTRTIKSWTGLTDDRIRKLYRSYVADAGRRVVRRHRGKSPRQSAFFMRNAGVRREAAGLATQAA